MFALARTSALVLSVVFATVAEAQEAPPSTPPSDGPSLGRAAALIEDADFEAARVLLAELAAGEGFSGHDVLVWLGLSALVEFALTGTPPADELRALVALDPAHSLGESVPPDLRNALEAARSQEHPRLEIAVEATSGPGRYRLRAVVSNDGAGIVREPRVLARPRGEREWRTSEGGLLAIETRAEEIAYYAEAIGPGGAIIARQGSADAPLVLRSTAPVERVEEAPVVVEEEGDFPTGVVVALSAGAAVAIGVAVVLALILPVSPASPLERPSFDFGP